MVILRSRSLARVRVAMMAGTLHPKPMSMRHKGAARQADVAQQACP